MLLKSIQNLHEYLWFCSFSICSFCYLPPQSLVLLIMLFQLLLTQITNPTINFSSTKNIKQEYPLLIVSLSSWPWAWQLSQHVSGDAVLSMWSSCHTQGHKQIQCMYYIPRIYIMYVYIRLPFKLYLLLPITPTTYTTWELGLPYTCLHYC
jgi:ABC-type transport system involved in multi-copper enzyme maturation permease subunit